MLSNGRTVQADRVSACAAGDTCTNAAGEQEADKTDGGDECNYCRIAYLLAASEIDTWKNRAEDSEMVIYALAGWKQ